MVRSRGRSGPKVRTKAVDVAELLPRAAAPEPAGTPMTYQIHRYPAELIDVVHLTSGDRIVIRPVLPQDWKLMVAFFHNLSADARSGRFMHPVTEPSSELLREFTQVDYAEHVALIAEIFVGGHETVIGEVRYVRAADRSSAEFSVSVADLWQGKGLASLMLTKLESRAVAAGVRRIVGETLATNEKMLALARKAGFLVSESERGVVRLEKTLALRGITSVPAQSSSLPPS